MKRLLIPFLFLTGVIGYLSCQKENSSDLSSVKAAKTDGIKKGEPVTFSVENTSGQTAKWSVTPSTNVLLTSDGNNAKILFRNSGSYSVIASMGNITERIMVNVSDSSYCDSTRRDTCCGCPRDTIPRDSIPGDTCRTCGPRDTTLPLTGDQIHITPMKMDSGAVSGLVIKAITQHTYPCVNNYLASFVSITDTTHSNYAFNYTGVYIPRNCASGQAPSKSTIVLSPVQDGYHVFKVLLNNVTYTGSFTKTGNQYSFTWPYTSGVTISPLTIN
jgi:hypothetical protein